ncbi:hypothetical protein TIFTF001_004798 [Ficus carica]|uniref:Uncharacterized protein n=1 Tax=Ficus carica TaxID=3494 RepID=A0AA88A5Q6_FICCA|nr:hypothetical protein TIFTF001_004798 [Ficus carica]
MDRNRNLNLILGQNPAISDNTNDETRPSTMLPTASITIPPAWPRNSQGGVGLPLLRM